MRDLWTVLGGTEEDGPEGLPVLAAHQVVQDGVEGGGEEVEAAGDVHEVLVECAVPGQVVVVVVVVGQPLHVEGSPRDEEHDHHRACRLGYLAHVLGRPLSSGAFGWFW